MNNLETIINEIIKQKPRTKAELNDIRRKISNSQKVKQPSNRELLSAYQKLAKKKSLKLENNTLLLLRKADIRTLSGVAIVTSLTKPFPCPGKCIYCPVEKNMPKSYLASEPAAARALKLKFNPYTQMQKRILMLEQSGHPTDKIEFIVKGGTWNAYTIKYQYWFILRSFQACNGTRSKLTPRSSLKNLQSALEKEQKKNETAKYRVIGLTLETRPDAINAETVFHMRKQGCTRIELGLQATDDKILKLTKRGHTVQQFKDAILLLRQAGFKVDLHFMPDLPGSNEKKDVQMYKQLFSDPALKPDMVKIYPCSVIKTAELYKWHKAGKYKPYNKKKLFQALVQMKKDTPRYCRISRLVRDIPTNDIQAGNSITNLREELKKEMREKKVECKCLRCREIGHQKIKRGAIKLFIDKYQTVGGKEYFISYEDPKRKAVFAFLRLRLPEKTESKLYDLIPEIQDCAFIRELHTYGQLVEVGERSKTDSQHKGLGKKLVKDAEKIAKEANFNKMAVISGVGVRGYYRKLGYKKSGTYMTKSL